MKTTVYYVIGPVWINSKGFVKEHETHLPIDEIGYIVEEIAESHEESAKKDLHWPIVITISTTGFKDGIVGKFTVTKRFHPEFVADKVE